MLYHAIRRGLMLSCGDKISEIMAESSVVKYVFNFFSNFPSFEFKAGI